MIEGGLAKREIVAAKVREEPIGVGEGVDDVIVDEEQGVISREEIGHGAVQCLHGGEL